MGGGTRLWRAGEITVYKKRRRNRRPPKSCLENPGFRTSVISGDLSPLWLLMIMGETALSLSWVGTPRRRGTGVRLMPAPSRRLIRSRDKTAQITLTRPFVRINMLW
jgi:hypothetical protein